MQLIKDFIFKWYPVILAFFCLILCGFKSHGQTDEAMYTAHWPATILLFALTIRQRRR